MKLRYFAVRGRVDMTRLVLELAGAPYTFEGITVDAWREGSAKRRTIAETPYGQLPVLEDGAFVMCQSQAILRYVAAKFGLAGATPEERAVVDETSESAFEIVFDMALRFWDPAFHEKRSDHRELLRGRLEKLQEHFRRRTRDGIHWVGTAPTAADASMAYALETVLVPHPGLVETFGDLHRAMDRFFSLEPVRAYVTSDRRPRTWTVGHATFGGKEAETHQF